MLAPNGVCLTTPGQGFDWMCVPNLRVISWHIAWILKIQLTLILWKTCFYIAALVSSHFSHSSVCFLGYTLHFYFFSPIVYWRSELADSFLKGLRLHSLNLHVWAITWVLQQNLSWYFWHMYPVQFSHQFWKWRYCPASKCKGRVKGSRFS